MQNQPGILLPLSYTVNSFVLLQSFRRSCISMEKESAYLCQLISLAKHSPDIEDQLREWVSVDRFSTFSITGLVLN
jgi:hypothetical protein